VLAEVARRLDEEVLAAATDSAEQVITGAIRVAFTDAIAEARTAVTALPGDLGADSLLRADDAARAAWFALESTCTRLDGLRSAAAVLRRLSAPIEHDALGQYAELRNLEECAPDWRTAETPWSAYAADPRRRLIAQLRAGGEPWLPTRAEQDAAWWSAYGERVEARQRGQHELAGFRAVFGG